MEELWRPVVGGKVIKKDWCVKFVIDYNNKNLRDFWKEKFSYAKNIRFDYYNVKANDIENIEDLYYTDFAVVHHQFLIDINTKDTCYICFIHELNEVSDINGLLYRIATTEFADIVRYNNLIAIKANNIKTVVA